MTAPACGDRDNCPVPNPDDVDLRRLASVVLPAGPPLRRGHKLRYPPLGPFGQELRSTRTGASGRVTAVRQHSPTDSRATFMPATPLPPIVGLDGIGGTIVDCPHLASASFPFLPTSPS